MSSKPLDSSSYYDIVFYAATKRGRMKRLELSPKEYQVYRRQVEALLEKMPQAGEEITLTLQGVTGVKATKALLQGAKALVQRVSDAAHKTMGRAAPAKSEIHVAIVRRPTVRVFERLIEKERRLEQQLTEARSRIAELPEAEQALDAFEKEVHKLRTGLQKAHTHFEKRELHQGMQAYAQVMKEHFPTYVKALQEWTICQKTAAHRHVEGFEIVQENRPEALLRDFEELRNRASESSLPPEDYARDWKTVKDLLTSNVSEHTQWLKRNAEIKALFAAKLAEEEKYLTSIKKTHQSDDWKKLKDLPIGYDLEGHKEKLEALGQATEKYVELLKRVNDSLAQGKTEKAIRTYLSHVMMRYQAVLDASTQLIVPQDQLEGRIGTKTELSVDLYRQPRGVRESKGALEGAALETLRKVLAEEDSAVAKPLEKALGIYQEKISKTQFTYTLRETLASEKTLLQHLHTFNELYHLDREALLNRYRAKGIPDMQISYLFSDLGHVEQVVEEMVVNLQKIVDEVNSQNFREAMNLYLKLMETQYPLYVEALKHSVDAQKLLSLFVERGIDIAAIFSEFCKERKKSFDIGSQFPLNLLFQRPLRHELFAKEILKHAARDHQIERDGRWSAAEEKILQANQSLNAYSDVIDRFVASDGLPKKLLLNPELDSDGKWKALLKKAGWTREDINRLSDVYDAYGGVMSTLFQMRRGYEVETDPDRKRVLKAQMRLHVDTRLEQINTIAGEYHRLMTPKRRAALEQAFEKSQLPEQPPIQRMFQAFEERRQYVSKQMEFLRFFHPLHQQSDVASRLLKNKESVWLKALKDAGWTVPKIQKFQKFYEKWMHVSEPILLAKARYGDDPENPILLADLRKILKDANKSVAGLNRELEKLGGIKALKTLEEMANEIGRLQTPKAPDLKITKQLQEVVQGVLDAMEVADTPQPTDSDYALFIYRNLPKGLVQQSWIQEMVRAYPAFTKWVNEIVIHQRAYEADPFNAKLRERLVKELKKKPPQPKVTPQKKRAEEPVKTVKSENLEKLLEAHDTKRKFLYQLYHNFNLDLPEAALSLW